MIVLMFVYDSHCTMNVKTTDVNGADFTQTTTRWQIHNLGADYIFIIVMGHKSDEQTQVWLSD